MRFGRHDWRTFEQGTQKEWLLTNGIGGFSCSTIIGANTRRYHGLLVASLEPPVARRLILSKIDESVRTESGHNNLYTFKTPGFIMEGFRHLQSVTVDPLPEFVFHAEGAFIKKTVCMVYGKNTVAVAYRIVNGPKAIVLRLAPLVNFRDYHHNASKAHMRFVSEYREGFIRIKPYDRDLIIRIGISEGSFTPLNDGWFFGMDYPVEQERGLPSTEDHYIPGYFDVHAGPWEEKHVTVVATTEQDAPDLDGGAIIDREIKRKAQLVKTAGLYDRAAGAGDEFAERLVMAADDFIVCRKSTGFKTILAGYPWFNDWGRDAMIAFNGLTLCTKRFEDARQILLTFAKHMKHGLIPNVFPDGAGEPAYNTVDAALWYIEAACSYVRHTGDYEFIRQHIYPVMKEIAEAYIKGTLFNIRMDEDCLIEAGDESSQLTWMDVKIGGHVVTPRHGKAVEVNALWYNALKGMAELSVKFGETASRYENIAAAARESFDRIFWNAEEQCLYDVARGKYRDARIRPNQILAVGLPHHILDGEKARKVVCRVWEKLYTPYGLRSLSQDAKEYRGVYAGDPWSRDTAYHQGTVWAWLTGWFVTGFLNAFGRTPENRERARMFLEPFEDHLRDACAGSVSEIFDGDEPYYPRGCFAQAWSVGEILRAYVETTQGQTE